LGSGNPGNKKGAQEPLDRAPPRSRVVLSTLGGAPQYENQRRRNKSPHGCALVSRLRFISIAAAWVKQNAAGIWLCIAAADSNERLKS
jgi:hypothetical protein